MSAISRDHGDSCGPLPAFFSQTPTGHRRFVENKHQTPIRQDSHKTVEALFSRVSHAQLRIVQLATYSVFKDQPLGAPLPAAQCGNLPFVRFYVKQNTSANTEVRPVFFALATQGKSSG